MNELTTFNNDVPGNANFLEISGVRCYEHDGVAYLNLEDVARGLGFTTFAKSGNEVIRWNTVYGYLEKLGVATSCNDKSYEERCPAYIPENIFYRLAMKAKNETAERFQAIVADEVIPSIRKHGAYMTEQKIDEILSDPDTIIKLATELKESRKRNQALIAENSYQRQVIADFEPVKQYVDTILESKGTLATTQIAADYGMSAVQLNRILKDAGIQWNVNGQWILRKQYMGKGYTDSKTIAFNHSDGRPDTKVRTVWTQKGRLMIHEVLTGRGIQALMDR